ncbi:hypothetical protein Htur_0473 [Haloterrigena turkmenica DSM 5511]|uniref:Polyprenyl synthetase n=1 Tax=Haloterrigena turkmenica (strain ATCC 51198 / DSM 5511 / JCM 9101 / NCIMB 13204 / VKM B-1734 / 4k) TaxID=543526 RepID=D2RVK7_HALTV|nr:hypothetical protein [Haloterrigena turkmenica]ADB59371.1 hypothetical protein Htur_0473 [Haloterrigena turkmenica DSM 5511]
MDRADSCRRAAFEAVADVEPPALHDRIETALTEASMVPGVLTLESAATTADGRAVAESERSAETDRGHAQRRGRDGDRDTDGLATQAAGVQLIYEGLRLTRSLAHDEPWAADGNGDDESDLAILAADILVARGFYLLARTDAAGKAVRTVQKFGRDQTRRDAVADRSSGPTTDADGEPVPDDSEATTIDANLERDILELAVRTGAAAVGDAPSQRLLATAEALADTVGPSFPPAADCLADLEPMPGEQSLEDPTTDRATSATDP